MEVFSFRPTHIWMQVSLHNVLIYPCMAVKGSVMCGFIIDCPLANSPRSSFCGTSGTSIWLVVCRHALCMLCSYKITCDSNHPICLL